MAVGCCGKARRSDLLSLRLFVWFKTPEYGPLFRKQGHQQENTEIRSHGSWPTSSQRPEIVSGRGSGIFLVTCEFLAYEEKNNIYFGWLENSWLELLSGETYPISNLTWPFLYTTRPFIHSTFSRNCGGKKTTSWGFNILNWEWYTKLGVIFCCWMFVTAPASSSCLNRSTWMGVTKCFMEGGEVSLVRTLFSLPISDFNALNCHHWAGLTKGRKTRQKSAHI